jgi:hypothetical protein
MIVVGGDMGLHDGKLPHILGLGGAGIARDMRHTGLALRAGIGIVVAHHIDMARIGQRALVPRMPELTAAGSPARRAGWTGRRRWGVGRWGFRRVLGMKVQAGIEIGEAGMELGDLLLLVGNSLLLGQNDQQRLHALSYRERRSRPVVWGDTSRWQVAVHAASMAGVGTPVKWGRLGGRAETP